MNTQEIKIERKKEAELETLVAAKKPKSQTSIFVFFSIRQIIIENKIYI